MKSSHCKVQDELMARISSRRSPFISFAVKKNTRNERQPTKRIDILVLHVHYYYQVYTNDRLI